MKPCLADVNFILPLLISTHEHHPAAHRWWSLQPPGKIGLCRTVQLSVIRLLSNQRIMQSRALTARAAWDLVAELLTDERIEFWSEPTAVDDVLPTLLRYSVPTPALVSDAYLAAFALARQSSIVTFDQGFQQFNGLSIEFLNHTT